MRKPIRACIFDLDGVLIDTTTYHYQSWRKVCKTFGFDFREEDNEPLKGASRMHSLEIILGLADIEMTAKQKEDICSKKNQFYLESIQAMSADEILPGVVPLLNSLQKVGLKMAVGSASKNARFILEQVNLTNYFHEIVDGNAVVHSKPDPEVFLLAAKRLNVDPHECLVFEDAAKGIEAAKRAEMLTVGVGNPNVLQDADLVVGSLEDYSWTKLKEKISLLETS